MKNFQLDATDLRILAQLQADEGLSNVNLARRVHLSPSLCLLRVKALKQVRYKTALPLPND